MRLAELETQKQELLRCGQPLKINHQIKARDMKPRKSRYYAPTIKERVILKPVFYLLLIITIIIVFVGPIFIKR